MGISANAILFFGYTWKTDLSELEHFEPIESADGEWAQVVLINRGEENPWDDYEGLTVPNDPDAPDAKWEPRVFTENGRVLVDQWYRRKQDVEEEYGVEYFTHGSQAYRIPALAVKGVKRVAYGDSLRIDVESLVIPTDGYAKLSRWMTDLGIPTDEADGPGWFLVTEWDY